MRGGKQCLEWNSPHPHKWKSKKRKKIKKRKCTFYRWRFSKNLHYQNLPLLDFKPKKPTRSSVFLFRNCLVCIVLTCTPLWKGSLQLPTRSTFLRKKINPKSYMALPFDQLCFRFTLSHKGRGFAGNPQSKIWERYCMARYHLKMFHLFPQGTVHLKCSKFTSFWLFFSPLNFSLTHPPSHHHHHHPGS